MPWYAPAFGQWPHWANAGSALEKSFRAMGWVETDGTIPTPGVPVDPAAARLVKAINGKLADTTGGITLAAADVGAIPAPTGGAQVDAVLVPTAVSGGVPTAHGYRSLSQLGVSNNDRDVALLSLSRSPATEVAVVRVSASRYRLAYRLGGQDYARFDLSQISNNPGALPLHQLRESAIDMPWLSVNDTDGAVTRSATGWAATTTAQPAAYGGEYRSTTTGVAGAYVDWQPPVGASRVGVRFAGTANSGIHVVAIDGDTTRANLLPTAAEYVAMGRLASTALVANGGTLNPTDRVLDSLPRPHTLDGGTPYDIHAAIADGLDPAAQHTVRITTTAYRNAIGAVDVRFFLGGFTYATLTTSLDTAGAELLAKLRLMVQFGSAYEYAHEFRPTAGGAATWVGNVHGYEAQDSLTVYQDGATVTMTDGQVLRGQQFEIVRQSRLRHPAAGAGATDVALVTTVYRISADGLRVSHTTTWQLDATVSRSHPAMLPVDGPIFTRGATTASPADFDLTPNAGGYLGKAKAATIYAWSPTGQVAAILHMPDLAQAVDGWARGDDMYASIEDRVPADVNAGNLSKMYVTRVGPGVAPQAVTAGAVWRSTALYRVMRAVNVDQLLAR